MLTEVWVITRNRVITQTWDLAPWSAPVVALWLLSRAGEEGVLGVASRAGGSRERVQDAVDVEQEQGEAGGHCLLIAPT